MASGWRASVDSAQATVAGTWGHYHCLFGDRSVLSIRSGRPRTGSHSNPMRCSCVALVVRVARLDRRAIWLEARDTEVILENLLRCRSLAGAEAPMLLILLCGPAEAVPLLQSSQAEFFRYVSRPVHQLRRRGRRQYSLPGGRRCKVGAGAKQAEEK
jgi:hypothetical protein